MDMIPDLSPYTAKWVISGLITAVIFLVWVVRSMRCMWREDKVYYHRVIERLENIIEAKAIAGIDPRRDADA